MAAQSAGCKWQGCLTLQAGTGDPKQGAFVYAYRHVLLKGCVFLWKTILIVQLLFLVYAENHEFRNEEFRF